jgi:hypothetical protein
MSRMNAVDLIRVIEMMRRQRREQIAASMSPGEDMSRMPQVEAWAQQQGMGGDDISQNIATRQMLAMGAAREGGKGGKEGKGGGKGGGAGIAAGG